MRKKQWWDHFINIISYLHDCKEIELVFDSIKPHTGSWIFSFDIISRKWVHLSLWGKYLDNNTQTVLLTPSKMRQARLNVSRFLGAKISWPSTYFICLSHCSERMKWGRKTFLQNTKVYKYVRKYHVTHPSSWVLLLWWNLYWLVFWKHYGNMVPVPDILEYSITLQVVFTNFPLFTGKWKWVVPFTCWTFKLILKALFSIKFSSAPLQATKCYKNFH